MQSPLATVTNKRAVTVVKNARTRMSEYFIDLLEQKSVRVIRAFGIAYLSDLLTPETPGPETQVAAVL